VDRKEVEIKKTEKKIMFGQMVCVNIFTLFAMLALYSHLLADWTAKSPAYQ